MNEFGKHQIVVLYDYHDSLTRGITVRTCDMHHIVCNFPYDSKRNEIASAHICTLIMLLDLLVLTYSSNITSVSFNIQ